MLVSLRNIGKRYYKRFIFKGIDGDFALNDKIAFLGNNGSGKSTLVRICAGYLSPDEGEISFELNGLMADKENVYKHIAISAPYVELIEEMTLLEFLEFHFSYKRNLIPIPEMIKVIGLQDQENILIENFSSGMKQRVSLAQAFFSDTSILLLDEPCSNLDEKGFALYTDLLSRFTKNRIVIIASNDPKEYEVCNKQVLLSEFT